MKRVGLYCVPPRALSCVADLGVNIVQHYGLSWLSSLGEHVDYFDACERLGLKVLCSIPLSMLTRPFDAPEQAQRCQEMVFVLRSHPALYAWYLLDEPENASGEQRTSLRTQANALYIQLHALAPHIPVVIASCSWLQHVGSYKWPGDVILSDIYPVRPYSPFGAYFTPLAWAGLALRHRCPVYPVLQTHDAMLWNCHPYREPSEYEMWWMCHWAKSFDEVWFFGGVMDDLRLQCGDPQYYKPDYDITRPGRQAQFRRWLRYLGR